MLYRRAHIRDCARHMGVIFPVVLLVSGLIFIAQLLGDTVALALPASSLWQFLALAVLKYVPQLLIVSLFAGVLLAVGRAFHEHEMDAWFTAGIGLRHFLLPGALFALPVIVAIALAAIYLTPWSVRTADALRAQLASEINPDNIRAGEFGFTPGNLFTYFFQGDQDAVDSIFIVRNNGGFHEVITTAAARRTNRDDGHFLALEHGVFYRLPRTAAQDLAAETTGFESLLIYLPSAIVAPPRPRGAKIEDLQWQNPQLRAEIIWRMNQPLAAIFLVLLAPFVARSHPRLGRGTGFFIALLLFCIHLNLIYFARDGVANDSLPAIMALLLPPAVVFAAAWAFERPLRR